MDKDKVLDKAHGVLIGSALGDTIGLYTEFMSPEIAKISYPEAEFSLVEPVTEPRMDPHRSRFEKRAWTDDTDHTILMVLSFLRNGEFLPDDFAKRLHTWCNHGLLCLDRPPMGIGRTVWGVVMDEDYTQNPTKTAFEYWYRTGRKVAPNGSLMRTSPVGVIFMQASEEETFKQAIRIGVVTHSDPRCGISVAIVSGLIRGMCRGEIKTEEQVNALIERAWEYMKENHAALTLERDEFDKHAYAQSLDSLVLHEYTMGYVYKCLGSSLWCLRQLVSGKETYKSAMTKLAMCAGDADTNGAVAGGLMGAFVGFSNLPPEWRDGLKHKEWYREKITALCVVAGLTEGEYDKESDKDTLLDGGTGLDITQKPREIIPKVVLPIGKKTTQRSNCRS